MEKKYVSWNDLPDTLSKEQFYKICHISKKTASDLLNSGKVPCIKSDKRTHKFKIRKADAIEYMKHKEELTAYSSADYREIKKADLIKFYTKLLRACPDVITPSDIHDITGFRKETIYRWCQKGKLKSFKSHNRLQIPKRYFISFLVSPEFNKIAAANPDGKYEEVVQDSAKTKSGLRTLPLVGNFKRYFQELKESQELNRQICGNSYNYDYIEYVFVDELGERIKPGYITGQFPKLLEKHGFRHIRFHDLRHCSASLLLANGVPMKQIQEWLGHSDF